MHRWKVKIDAAVPEARQALFERLGQFLIDKEARAGRKVVYVYADGPTPAIVSVALTPTSSSVPASSLSASAFPPLGPLSAAALVSDGDIAKEKKLPNILSRCDDLSRHCCAEA
jgi:hypothetical protein